jgi:hypothetical protein
MDSPYLKLFETLQQKALQLRNESERMLFLAVFSALGVTTSVGVGILLRVFTAIPFAIMYGTIVSSFLLIPLFLLIGINLWEKMKKTRALSGDRFDYLKYMKDEYDQDIKEIKGLSFSESEKKRLIRKRFDAYTKQRTEVRQTIEEISAQRRTRRLY